MYCIFEKASIFTRRSAGLPPILTGILAAEAEGTIFRRAMDDLEKIATSAALEGRSGNSGLPQVHAMNCLKEVLTSTKLATATEPYITGALDTAATCLTSELCSTTFLMNPWLS